MNLSRIPVGWPEDKEAIPFSALAAIFASAVTPAPDVSDPEDLAFHLRLIDYKNRLSKAVQECELIIRNPVTWEALPCWANSDGAIVRVSDVKAYLERTGSVIELVPLKKQQQLPAPVTWQGHTYQPGPELTPEEIEEGAAWADAMNKAEVLKQTERQNWHVVKPKRFSPYGAALLKFLSSEWQKGRMRIPKARDVLEAWSITKPPEIYEVMHDGLKYFDTQGNVKELSLAALKEAIARRTKVND